MAVAIPTDIHVTYQFQHRKCGKAGCIVCSNGPGHGPYRYAYWREDGRLKSAYVGNRAIPADVSRREVAKKERPIAKREEKKPRPLEDDTVFSKKQWLALAQSYNYTCLCCKRSEPEIKLVADHVIPTSRGGENALDNIQPLCFSCNARKGVKSMDYR